MANGTGDLRMFVVVTFIVVLLIQCSVIYHWVHRSSSNSSSSLSLSFNLNSNSSSNNSVIIQIRSLKTRRRTGHEKDVETRESLEKQDALNALKECPKYPPDLIGPISVNLHVPPTIKELENLHVKFDLGGHFQPVIHKCRARQKVAILIPYRNREQHLRIFLYNVLPFLTRQRLDFRIYVVEQKHVLEFSQGDKEKVAAPNSNSTSNPNLTFISNSSSSQSPFNRAMLFNVGFVEALKRDKYDCFIFTDVDLIPEDDRNIYACEDNPVHLSVAIDTWNYTLPYKSNCGGVMAFKTEHFRLINGFSNKYFGWGSEDDDLSQRIKHKNLTLLRPNAEIARYTMIRHQVAEKSRDRITMLKNASTRFYRDGLSNLRYKMEDVVLNHLFTLFKVSLVKS